MVDHVLTAMAKLKDNHFFLLAEFLAFQNYDLHTDTIHVNHKNPNNKDTLAHLLRFYKLQTCTVAVKKPINYTAF